MNSRKLAEELNRYTLSYDRIRRFKYQAKREQIHYPHYIESYCMHLIIGGQGTYYLNNIRYDVGQGQLMIVSPGTLFEGYHDSKHPLDVYSLRFHAALMYREDDMWQLLSADPEKFPLVGIYQLYYTQDIMDLFTQMYELEFPGRIGDFSNLRKQSLLREIIHSVLQDMLLRENSSDTIMLVESTIEFLNSHYKEDISVSQLAERAGLSISQYCKLFKERTGYSPKEYLIQLRINRAKQLLEISRGNMKNIAWQVGYTDEFYFSRIFKKVVGISPSEYVKKRTQFEHGLLGSSDV